MATGTNEEKLNNLKIDIQIFTFEKFKLDESR